MTWAADHPPARFYKFLTTLRHDTLLLVHMGLRPDQLWPAYAETWCSYKSIDQVATTQQAFHQKPCKWVDNSMV